MNKTHLCRALQQACILSPALRGSTCRHNVICNDAKAARRSVRSSKRQACHPSCDLQAHKPQSDFDWVRAQSWMSLAGWALYSSAGLCAGLAEGSLDAAAQVFKAARHF